MLDLKGVDSRLPAELLRLLEQRGGTREVLVCSRHWRLIDRLRGSGVARAYSAGTDLQLAAVGARAARAGAAAVCIHRRLASGPAVRSLRDVVPRVMVWAVTTVDAARELTRDGVNGLILDDLDLSRAMPTAVAAA